MILIRSFSKAIKLEGALAADQQAKLAKRVAAEQEMVKARFSAEVAKFEAENEVNGEEEEIHDPEYTKDGVDLGSPLGEFGMRPRGPEPTRYGDWMHKGRTTDF